ncbi:MAG TPA: DUF1573 domain-containing protein [Thermoanaerobaculia bacterium]|nr:DUF1573 domain-containing protein [Thermoanaerobaculia bacterium]
MLSKRLSTTTLAAVATFVFSGISMAASPATAKKPAAAKPAANAKATESATTPKIDILEPVKDYGTVPKGTKIDWAFQVKNSGTSDLEIKSAAPSCGCTVTDFDKVIKPGQTGKITAHVDTVAFSGPISKHVTVMSNDPATPATQLTLNAVVKPYVEALPNGFLRFNVLQGAEQTQTVTLYSEEDQPFEIRGVDVPPGEYVKVNYVKIDKDTERVPAGKEGQTQYKVNVTLGGPKVPTGPMSDHLVIHTNSKFQPDYTISLSGVVRPTYMVMPTVLNFGEVSSADPSATRTVTVQSNDKVTPDQFKVSKVESSVKGLVAVAKASDQPGMYEVNVKVDKTAKLGDFDGTLKIYTSDKLNPVTTVPLKGTVTKNAPKANSSK